MTTPVARPADPVLRDYLLGKPLSADEVRHVERWMDEDPDAKQVLAGVSANDTVVNALKPGDTDLPERGRAGNGPATPKEIGDYILGAELGRGGMGEVFAAVNKHTGQQHAIKLIAPAHATNPLIRERFLREARAVARIDHPNVVPILHVGEEVPSAKPEGFGGRLYIVMPLLKGETLASRLARDRAIPPDDLVRIACDIAAGLAAAHALGLVHRDIKPANVWLDAETGRARILDFGLVKPLDAKNDGLTATGAVMGTPNYMSPEQAEARPVDTKSDLFSLGALLYHAATGEVPFKGESYIQVLIAIKSDTPPRPEKLNTRLPARLAGVIRLLLEKEPADRPGSATEVIEELHGKAAPRRAQRHQPPRRRKYVAVAAACLLLGLGAAFTVYQVEFTTKEGTLLVQVTDKETDLRFKDGELRIYGDDGKLKYTLKANERNAKLPAGRYTVKVVGADGVVLETPEFTMTKNGEAVVRVSAKAPAVVKKDAPPPSDADRKAAEWVVSVGGKCEVNDDEVSFHWWVDKPLPPGPIRLKQVYLAGNPHVTDDKMAVFQNCKNLTHLYLNQTPVGDKGMIPLKGCDNLRHLILLGTRVGDAGLAHLKGCKSLTGLALNGTPVTDAGLAHLPDYKSLGNLVLDSTGVGDAGLARLKDCKGLAHLGVNKTKVTEKGVVALAKELPGCAIDWDGRRIEPSDPELHAILCVLDWGGSVTVNDLPAEIARPADLPKPPLRLRWVSLAGHRGTSEDCLAVFKNCKELTHLDLRGTLFGDALADHLRGCRQLRELDVRNTKVSLKGFQELVKALPECRIVSDGNTYDPKKK